MGTSGGRCCRPAQWKLRCAHEANNRLAMGKQLVGVRGVRPSRAPVGDHLRHRATTRQYIRRSLTLDFGKGGTVRTPLGRGRHAVRSWDQPGRPSAGIRLDPGHHGILRLPASSRHTSLRTAVDETRASPDRRHLGHDLGARLSCSCWTCPRA